MGGDLAHVALAVQGAPAGSPQSLALAIAAKGKTTLFTLFSLSLYFSKFCPNIKLCAKVWSENMGLKYFHLLCYLTIVYPC